MGTVQFETAVHEARLVFLGCVPLRRAQRFAAFRRWLNKKYHADMSYLERNCELRADPRRFGVGLQTALVVALPYRRGDRLHTTQPRVAQYARQRDYHRVIRLRARRVITSLQLDSAACRVVVDTAPVLERELAERGGHGFVGKNTCFISLTHGSYLLLGAILIPVSITAPQQEVEPPPATTYTTRTARGGCGSCRRCQVHCPTGALQEAYQLDARKCLAWLTIENRGEIPRQYWQYLGNYYYGCDLCQIVCPYNRGKRNTEEAELKLPPLEKIACMTQREYEQYFGGTALTRAKRAGLMRNALIAMYVRRHPQLQHCLTILRQRTDLPQSEGLQKTRTEIEALLCHVPVTLK